MITNISHTWYYYYSLNNWKESAMDDDDQQQSEQQTEKPSEPSQSVPTGNPGTKENNESSGTKWQTKKSGNSIKVTQKTFQTILESLAMQVLQFVGF